jgi:hypothetical protein
MGEAAGAGRAPGGEGRSAPGFGVGDGGAAEAGRAPCVPRAVWVARRVGCASCGLRVVG